MNANNDVSRNPLQRAGSGSDSSKNGNFSGECGFNGEDFLQILARAAGQEGANALVPADNARPRQGVGRKELADLFAQIMALLDASGFAAGAGNSGSDTNDPGKMPNGENTAISANGADLSSILEGLLAGAGSGLEEAGGESPEAAAVFARAMGLLPAGQGLEPAAGSQDRGTQTQTSPGALLQSLADDLKTGEKNLRQFGGRPDQAEAQGGSSGEKGQHTGRARDLMPEITAMLEKAAQNQGRAAGTNAKISSEAAVQALQEFAAKNARTNPAEEQVPSLRTRMQEAEPVLEAKASGNRQNPSQAGRPQQQAGADNLRAMLDSLVSASMEKTAGMERTQNRQAVLKDGAPQANANMNPSATATGLFEKAENATSTVQPGGASFDSQFKAAESQVVNQVAVRLFTGVRQGSGSMTIQIHPPELGSVKVKVVS
ncbi:MAG: hypothetical protein ACOC1H_03195, partial [Desulfosalsimonas sp.]